MKHHTHVTTAVLVLTLLAGTAADAAAQYFGQNQVRYGDVHFKVLTTEHFDIYYYDRSERTIQQAARLAERWYTRLSTILDHRLTRRQPIILYANHADFEQNTVVGPVGEGTGGVTEPLRNRVVLPFTASLAETDHVLGHELVHAFQFDMGRRNTTRLPLWFVEGMAEYLSLGPTHALTALWLRDATVRNELPGFDKLTNPRLFPYRFGHAAWAYIAGRWGDGAVGPLFVAASETGDPVAAIERLAGTKIDRVSAGWHEEIRGTYRDFLAAEAPMRGRPLITDEGAGGDMNVGPSLSPDGSRIMFFSERELLSIEMFLADARTGRIIRKITSFATNPHFDRIQFLASTGAWSRDGQRFAYTTVKGATPVIEIIEAGNGDRVREIELRELGDAINPTWSPDGRYIAVSGMSGGVSDLFVYDLQENRLDQVTRDLYAQIQPEWSPDGRSIAFVTDQFSSTLDTLTFGDYRLALFDVASRTVRALPSLDTGKNINPKWSPDGQTLFFVGEPNGVPNVFRMTLPGGTITPLTAVATGVTGITETSPAIDVASKSSRLAFTVFTGGKYEIHVLEGNDLERSVQQPRVNAARLPAPSSADRQVAAALASPRGLPQSGSPFSVAPYNPKLGLEFIGAAAATGFNASALGTSVGGGVAMQFSDLLNLHQVTGVVDATSARSGRDIAGQVTYLNRATRWNLGASVQWVPYVTGTFSQGLTQVNGSTVLVEREQLFRQTNRQVLGLAQYPINRATRLELAGGLRSIGFGFEDNLRFFSPVTGQFLGEQRDDLPAPATLNLAQTTGAFVYDTSVFGVASPLLGTRARFEVSPTFGSLRFTELVADARRYVMPVRPLTLAGRAMYVGRHGADSEDTRLTPLYLGYPSLVRGYEIGTFSADECVATATSDCPAFDRLIGSKLFLASAEARFPLVGIFQGQINYGSVPVEGFVFGDAGVAWNAGQSLFSSGDRRWVRSAGVGLRANAFGYAIVELAVARPFDRPDNGWRWVFNLIPGF
jgi:Tol biopolymer transport system component